MEPIDLATRRAERQAREPLPETGAFVCTACGSTFTAKRVLELHWEASPACKSSLSRPVGQFGSRTLGQHCPTCTICPYTADSLADPCPKHAYRGCPGC